MNTDQTSAEFTLFSDFDIGLFKEGKHYQLYTKFGSHRAVYKNTEGTYFAVWAPSGEKVSVMGNFNAWNREKNIYDSVTWQDTFPFNLIPLSVTVLKFNKS